MGKSAGGTDNQRAASLGTSVGYYGEPGVLRDHGEPGVPVLLWH